MSIAPAALEFGIYRDGDNNLDHEQALVINQALRVSSRDSSIEFVVEDTTSRRGLLHEGALRTESYLIRDGAAGDVRVETPHDPSSRENLAAFVARTLDRAQETNAKQPWIELVDHIRTLVIASYGGDEGGVTYIFADTSAPGTRCPIHQSASSLRFGRVKTLSKEPHALSVIYSCRQRNLGSCPLGQLGNRGHHYDVRFTELTGRGCEKRPLSFECRLVSRWATFSTARRSSRRTSEVLNADRDAIAQLFALMLQQQFGDQVHFSIETC